MFWLNWLCSGAQHKLHAVKMFLFFLHLIFLSLQFTYYIISYLSENFDSTSRIFKFLIDTPTPTPTPTVYYYIRLFFSFIIESIFDAVSFCIGLAAPLLPVFFLHIMNGNSHLSWLKRPNHCTVSNSFTWY